LVDDSEKKIFEISANQSIFQTVHECSLDGLLQILGFLFRFEIRNGGYVGLSLTLDPMGKMFQNASSLKPPGQFNPNCPKMSIGRYSTNYFVDANQKFLRRRHLNIFP
jgi:hypothetical protein